MMAPRLQQNSILQLTEQDIAQASNPVWGGADWKPGFIMDNSKDRRSGFLTDAGRKTILLKGKSFTDHFLREYHQAFSGETAQSKSVQLTNLSRRLLELGHDLFIWQDPFAAYIQGLVQVTDIAFNSALGNIKAEMPEIGAIKPAGSVENSFESELDPLTSERRAVLKIRNNFTHLEFSDINGEVSKVPFRASLEYDYVFVPGSDSTQRGSYQLRFPIIIRGEDAQLCRGIITQSQLSDGIKDEIIARYQKGIKHVDYFKEALNKANPNFKQPNEEGNYVVADPDFIKLEAGITDSTKSLIERQNLAQHREFFVDMYQQLNEAVKEFYLYERTQPLAQIEQLNAEIRQIQDRFLTPKNPDFYTFSSILRQKAIGIVNVFSEQAQNLQIESEAKQLIENAKVRYLGHGSQDLTRDQRKWGVSDMLCEAIKKASSEFRVKQIIKAYVTETNNPSSALSKLMRDKQHPTPHNKIIKTARQFIEGKIVNVQKPNLPIRRNLRGYTMNKAADQAPSLLKSLLKRAFHAVSQALSKISSLFFSQLTATSARQKIHQEQPPISKRSMPVLIPSTQENALENPASMPIPVGSPTSLAAHSTELPGVYNYSDVFRMSLDAEPKGPDQTPSRS